ncbi:endonuclease [Aureococcus anophagefferens]|nr:endonuclease [Aureococcus anophagefferens]
MTQLKKLQTRSIELAAEADPAHFGAFEKTRKAAEARFLKTAKIDATRARRMLDAVDKDALHLARATYRETTLKARAAATTSRRSRTTARRSSTTRRRDRRAAPPPPRRAAVDDVGADGGPAPTLRTWRALLRACKVGDAPAGHAFAILEEIEAQTAARAGRDGLVDVSIYNAVIDICGHAGAWRRALQVFNRLRHHGIAPTTHTYSCVMAAAVGVPADSTEVYEGLKFAGIPEYIAYTAATAHALSWKPHASAAAKASHYNDTSLRRASTSGASSSFAFSSRGPTDGADRGDASGAPYRAPGT